MTAARATIDPRPAGARRRTGRAILTDRAVWLAVVLTVAATTMAAIFPHWLWILPVGFMLLAFLCAARTLAQASRTERRSRWRSYAAGAGFVFWGLQWGGNALLNGWLAGDVTVLYSLSALSRAAIVVALMPLTPDVDRIVFRLLDVALSVIFAAMLALLSFPGLLASAAGEPDPYYAYVGFVAMAVFAGIGVLAERSTASRRLIVAIFAMQIVYAVSSIVTAEIYARGLVEVGSAILSHTALAFITYLALLGSGAPAPDDGAGDRGDAVLPSRLLPLAVTALIVAFTFALFPAMGQAAPIAGVGAFVIHAVRTTLTENRYREEQRAAMVRLRRRAGVAIDLMHEIRSPLGLISLNAGLIARGAAAADAVPAMSRSIQSRCGAIAELLDDLLDLERIEAGMVKSQRRVCDVGAIVEQEVLALAVRAEEYGVAMEADEAMPPVLADPVALSRIFANLLNNALRFTPAGGRVTVTCTSTADAVAVTVADTGIGMPPDVEAHAFRRFCAPGTPIHGKRGSGLGLSIAHALARESGAELAIQRTDAQGTALVLVLDRAPSDNRKGATPRPAADRRS